MVAKTKIQMIFGPKFDKKFPTERRHARDGCTDGVWNTTTDGHFQTTGVDLVAYVGKSVIVT